MNTHHDLERRLADLLHAEAPRQAPDWVLRSALASIDTTTQRRVVIRVPWRFQTMNMFAKAAIAATAVVVLGAIGFALVSPNRPSGVGGTATPSPSLASSLASSPAASPSASASLAPSPSPSPLGPLTGSFTSAVYGVSASYPAGWTIHRATALWKASVPWACMERCSDYIEARENDSPFFAMSSQPLAGTAPGDWVAAKLIDKGWEGTCSPVTEPITIDGTNGTLATTCPDGLLFALTTKGDRGYAFVLYRITDIDQFKAILATVRLHPEAAVETSPSAAPAASSSAASG